MRKIANCALGILASVLASPAAVGQEKPKVVVESVAPQKAFSIESYRIELHRAQLQQAIMDVRLNTKRELRVLNVDAPLWLGNGVWEIALDHGQGSVPFPVVLEKARADRVYRRMRNGETPISWIAETELFARNKIETILYGLEKVADIVSGKPERGLPALDAASRATMMARRVLSTLQQTGRDSEPTVLKDSGHNSVDRLRRRWLNVAAEGDATDPLRTAVDSVRSVADVEEALKALDEVDKCLTTLRAVLWEESSR